MRHPPPPAPGVSPTRHPAPVPAGRGAVDADLLELSRRERAVGAARPDAVLHSAALADADRCEAEPDLARRCNVEASAAIARLCHARGVRLIALSTDLVLAPHLAFSSHHPPA